MDSGSTDATLDIASNFGVRVELMHPARYTPGASLNIAARIANTSIICPLSSHCTYRDANYISETLRLHQIPGVVATNGMAGWLLGPEYTSHGWPEANSRSWGLSNHAASYKKSWLERIPFDERLTACEDKRWAMEATAQGGSILFSTSLVVSANHRNKESPKRVWHRNTAEAAALRLIMEPSQSNALRLALDALWPWTNASRGAWLSSLSPRLTRLMQWRTYLQAAAAYRGASDWEDYAHQVGWRTI